MSYFKDYITKSHLPSFKGLPLFRINPENNWFNLVILFIIANLIILTITILSFYQINSDEIVSGAEVVASKSKTINRNSLEEVIKTFQKNGENFRTLIDQKPVFIDPSI